MLSREENELLTRVGPHTAMGRLMRRYWVPALLSTELDPGGDPKRVRLLGEDLVAFRDAEGRVGLVDESCPHRGASLALARAEGCGLRCLYHGWLIAADGRIHETPPEPEELGFKERIGALAYPARESGGVIWAYLGPKEAEPPLPMFEFAALPSDRVHTMKASLECNWAQVLEGILDSAHSNYLHSNAIKPAKRAASALDADLNITRPSNDGKPKLEVRNTAYGFRYAAIRKPLERADAFKFVRTSLFVAPFWGMVPSAVGWGNVQAMVPIDDGRTMFYHFKYCLDAPIPPEERARHEGWAGMRLGIDIDGTTFRPRATRNNTWLQDRAAMQRGESWSGLPGVAVEDFAVEESMGPIYDRTKEHLGSSDVAVIRMRRMMIDAARALADHGTPPPGLREPVVGDYRRLRAEEAMVPIDVPWESAMTCEDEARIGG
jgi:phthalate 4,5-dioxygenase oxygenase subunit